MKIENKNMNECKEIEKEKKFRTDSYYRRGGVLKKNHTVISSRL